MACTRLLYRDGGLPVEITVHGLRANAVADQTEGPCRIAVEDVLSVAAVALWAAVAAAAEPASERDVAARPAVEVPEQPVDAAPPRPARQAAAVPPPLVASESAGHRRACLAGETARQKLAGLRRAVSPTPPHPDGNRNR